MRNLFKRKTAIEPLPAPEDFEYSVKYHDGGFAFTVTPDSGYFLPVTKFIPNWANPDNMTEIFGYGSIQGIDIAYGHRTGYLTEDFMTFISSLVLESYERA